MIMIMIKVMIYNLDNFEARQRVTENFAAYCLT